MLEKTVTILERPANWTKGADYGQVYFHYSAEEGEDARLYEFKVDKQVWEDMGSPDTITVTIEPGDKLNDPVHNRWGGDIANHDVVVNELQGSSVASQAPDAKGRDNV